MVEACLHNHGTIDNFKNHTTLLYVFFHLATPSYSVASSHHFNDYGCSSSFTSSPAPIMDSVVRPHSAVFDGK